MVSNLQLFNNEGLELLINTQTGESFASVSGYSRMTGKSRSVISERLSKFDVITAEVETGGGVQSVRLISEDLMVEWLPKDNPEIATKMLKAGIRVFLHGLAGFSVSSSAIESQPKLPTHELAVQKARAIAEIEELLMNQPKLAQFLIDYTVSDLMEKKMLTGEEMRGVVEIAQEMGFPVNMNNRCKLGTFVRSVLPSIGKQEKRLVNGQMRPVWCYPDNQDVRDAISKFFNN